MWDIVDSGIGLWYRPASLCSLAGRYDKHGVNFISLVRDYEFGYRSSSAFTQNVDFDILTLERMLF
jgi:hypothetical protein